MVIQKGQKNGNARRRPAVQLQSSSQPFTWTPTCPGSPFFYTPMTATSKAITCSFCPNNTQHCISSIPWKLFEIHHQVSWSMGLIKLSEPTSSPLTTFTGIICLFLYLQVAIEERHLGCEGSSLMYHTAEQFVYCIAKISIFATPLCLKETILSSAHYHQT